MSNVSNRFYNIFSGAWRRRYVIVIPTLVMPFLGLSIGMMSPKNYTSHTSMLIQETAKMNPFLEDFAVSAMLKDRLAGLKTLLNSRHILGQVAIDRGLIDKDSSPQKHDYAVSKLSNALSISMQGKDLIRIDYKSNKPNGMKEDLEVISEYLVNELLAPERSSMRGSSRFLSQNLELRQLELDKAETELAKFKTKHSSELPEMNLVSIQRLSSLRHKLTEREAEYSGISKKLGSIGQQLSKTNPILGRIEEKIITLQGELALLRARYTDQHSSIKGTLRNIKRLQQERQSILSTVKSNVDIDKLWAIANAAPSTEKGAQPPLLVSQLENLQSARGEVDGLEEEIKVLKSLIQVLETKISRFGENEVEYSKLVRDIEVKRDLYDDLLVRAEKAKLTQSLSVFEQDKRIKIIDRPYKPSAPNNLPSFIFFIAGIIGGLLIGTGIATILELSNTTLRHRKQLEDLTNAPVISRIPPIVINNYNDPKLI